MSVHFLKSLIQYLRDNLSEITFHPDTWMNEDRAVPCCLVTESGGTIPFHADYTRAVTFLVEDDSKMDCRARAYEIHDFLLDGKGITLPAVETGDDDITAEVIESVNLPQYVSETERGRVYYSFNMVIRGGN